MRTYARHTQSPLVVWKIEHIRRVGGNISHEIQRQNLIQSARSAPVAVSAWMAVSASPAERRLKCPYEVPGLEAALLRKADKVLLAAVSKAPSAMGRRNGSCKASMDGRPGTRLE